MGYKIETLVNKFIENGSYCLEFNSQKLASGIYYCRVQIDGITSIKKMIIIK